MAADAAATGDMPCFAVAPPLNTAGPLERFSPRGEVAEWLNAPHSKCGIRATVSGVRIPPSPPPFARTPRFCDFRLQLAAELAVERTRPAAAQRDDKEQRAPEQYLNVVSFHPLEGV